MSIADRIVKRLWGAAAMRCSFKGCSKELSLFEDGATTLIGEVAHIVSSKKGGPRSGHYIREQFDYDSYDNLILLCQEHHKLFDDPQNAHIFTVELLKSYKDQHETNIKSKLSSNSEYRELSKYLMKIFDLADFMYWDKWTSFLLTPSYPEIQKELLDNLSNLNEQIVSQIEFEYHSPLSIKLYESVLNFRIVLNDFLELFDRHKIFRKESQSYVIDNFYKNRIYAHSYDDLARYHGNYIDLIHDYIYELSRSINLVIKNAFNIFEDSSPLGDKNVIISRGPNEKLSFERLLCLYNPSDILYMNLPYNQIKSFMNERKNRYHYVSDRIFDLKRL